MEWIGMGQDVGFVFWVLGIGLRMALAVKRSYSERAKHSVSKCYQMSILMAISIC